MNFHEYLIIGAGPGGLQMGYFMEQAGRDYLILEGGAGVAQFFRTKPRHRRLNSFNKRFNWFPEPEFNLRFDWNSLLTHDYSAPFREYSTDLYPLADVMVKYLGDFAVKYELAIQYNTRVVYVDRDPETQHFIVTDKDGNEYRCRVLMMATGPVKPVLPDFPGVEYVEGYESHDTDLKRFENKRVVILGHGNSAFETANHLANSAAVITILSRNKFLKHAWQTHYVGDVRAAGNAILDMSQLKLLHSVQGITPTKITKEEDGTLRLHYTEEFPHWTNPGISHGWVPVDHVIRCTGWKYLDPDLFAPNVLPQPSDASLKYPWLSSTWETTVSDLYYLGAAMEGRNRRSPTGFIHGYRYTVRTCFRFTEQRYQGVPTPREQFELKSVDNLKGLADHLISRISISSALYECYGIMADALVLDTKEQTAELFYELPADRVMEDPYFADKKVVLFTLEYGFDNFPNADLNSFVRRNDPDRPGCVAYLHPVFRYYENGVFVKGRNARSSSVIRYDNPAIDFEGDLGSEKPRNIIRNFINDIAGITGEVFPEDHFQNTPDQRFSLWPADKPITNPGLPQCALQVGGVQVRDFPHLAQLTRESNVPVPPWIHTM